MSSLEQPIENFDSLESKKYSLKSSTTNVHKVFLKYLFEFKAIHGSGRPDFTPRMWISLKPRSFEIPWGGRVNFINLTKNPKKSFKVVRSDNKKLYEDLYTFLIPNNAEFFYVNILNLENYDNNYSVNVLQDI